MKVSARPSQELFAALGEQLRLQLACCLSLADEGLCVCELVDALGVSQPNVSRHLAVMKAAGLVDERREGRWVYYRLADAGHPLVRDLRACLATVCCFPDVQESLRRVRARLKLRRGGKCVVGMQTTRSR